ncbi:MAG: alpha/beta fold hydrolase [Acidimicrobiales bacterium]
MGSTDAGIDLPRLKLERGGKGPPVVLVHGFTQTGASFRRVAELLADRTEVLTPDLPGHGGSPPATGDLETAASQLGAACGRGAYVGYSLGGRVCLHLALARPDLVERLVLVSTTAGIEDIEDRQARVAADEALADRIDDGDDEGIPSFIDEWLSGPLFRHLSEEAADRPSRLSNTAPGLAGSLRRHGTGTQMPLWERLRELTVPVLVVAGEEDPRFLGIGQRIAAAIGPNALFVLVPGAGHGVPFEQPVAFAGMVADFAAGETGPGTSSGPG